MQYIPITDGNMDGLTALHTGYKLEIGEKKPYPFAGYRDAPGRILQAIPERLREKRKAAFPDA